MLFIHQSWHFSCHDMLIDLAQNIGPDISQSSICNSINHSNSVRHLNVNETCATESKCLI